MQSSDLVSSFAEIASEKGMERDTLQLIIEDVFRAMIRKRYGSDESFEVIFNPDHGDIQVLHIREVVPDWDLEDPVTEIELSEAVEIDEDFELGDEVASELSIADFGRRAVMTARQTFRQRLRDIEKEHVYEKYSELVGEIVVGEVYQVRRGRILVMHDNVELVLPRSEQIRRDRFHKGDMVRAVVKEVSRDAGSQSQVVISRTNERLMERLFEIEVPEIYDGLVEIKRIVREPGNRAKVAVVSHDERIDPVGACVGMKGVRIHAVVRELSNENIDVLPWSDDPRELIKQALSPANPLSVEINEDLDPPRAKAVVHEDEVSQAIGRGGINIRLASRLTGYEIDVYRNILADEEDIDIEEFGDELPVSIINRLKEIGCDTAKAVLELSIDELQRRTGFERDVAEGVMIVIEMEFEDFEEELEAQEAEAELEEEADLEEAAVAEEEDVADEVIETDPEEEETAAEPEAVEEDAEADEEAASDGEEVVTGTEGADEETASEQGTGGLEEEVIKEKG